MKHANATPVSFASGSYAAGAVVAAPLAGVRRASLSALALSLLLPIGCRA